MASRLEAYLREVIEDGGARPGVLPSLLRGLLGGCAGLYAAGLELYLDAERLGLRRRGALPVPVVSVGNLTVGGTGKTPMTQMLCRRLIARGKRLAVLSRGHGGDSTEVRLVSDNGGQILLGAAEAGDEPLLLARTLPGVPVLVGKDRRRSGREALRRFALDALVLDDGFQYWQLARDLDIVLLDARRPFDNGYPLPRGLLREPACHLRRAAVVVATRAGGLGEAGRAGFRDRIAGLAPDAELYFARHVPTGLVRVGPPGAPVLPVTALRGARVLALSGIAQPASFARTLAGATGAEIVRHVIEDDHHRFDREEADAALRTACALRADAVVMTEKDAVKWPGAAGGGVPAYALRVEMCVEDEPRFLASVLRRLPAGGAAV